jgi:DNA-binding transcriptional LysR family regulator
VIDALECFLAVATHANFSRAAEKQNVAVSSVSRRIEILEAELGTKLFNRTSRTVTLTDAGERFLPRARHILDEVAEAREAVLSVQSEPRGLLTVTAPAAFGRRHVAPAVATFLLRYPLIEVDLHVGDEMVDLSSARVDVAVRIGVLPDSDLLATCLAPQRRVACASPEYLKRCGVPAAPEDLLNHNCLTVRTAPVRVGWWRFAGVNNNKALPIRGSLRTDDSDALMQAALAGVGVAHLATWLVGEEIRAGRLVSLFPDELLKPPVTDSAIHAVRMQGRSVTKAKLLIEHLAQSFGVNGGLAPYWERPAKEQIRKK